MRLRTYQWSELVGIFFLLASTATQIFYVDPLRREIEWRMATFSMQQNGQFQTRAIYDSRLAMLRSVKATPEEIQAAESERDAMLARYKTADANISDYLIVKEPIENYLQIVVVALFAFGTLLAGFGRAMEMIAARRVE